MSIGFGTVLIVDNLPCVPCTKDTLLEDHLYKVLKKLFGDFGVITHIWMPRDESTGMTKGRAFIKYNTPQEARRARKEMDGSNFKSLLG